MSQFSESVVEDAALAWLESLDYAVKHGSDISPGSDTLTLALPRGEGEHFRRVAATRANNATTRLRGQYAENAYCCFEKSNRFQTGNSSTFAIDANELRKRLGNYRGLLGC